MFAFGHGVARDWSLPAVQQALAGASVGGASAFVGRFESTARALLQQALDELESGAPR